MNLRDKTWKEFHIPDLFKIDSGNKFDKSKMTACVPTINFVGRSSVFAIIAVEHFQNRIGISVTVARGILQNVGL